MSKILLFGESKTEESRTFLGGTTTFLGESGILLGVSRNVFGEPRRLEDSEVLDRPLLVGVHGDPGLSSSGLVFTFSLMALLFHLEISAA